VRSERADGTWLELAGAEALYEPGEILHQDVAALTALFERVLAFGEPVELRRIRKEAAVAAALRRCARGRGWVFRVDAARAIFLEPARCPDRNALFASGDRRRDLDRKRRRLAESGVPAFEWLKPDTSDVDRIVALALDIEGSGWKTHAGTSVAQKPALAKFVRHVTRAFAEQGRLIVAFLTLNGAPIAMQVILVHNSAWCELKIGYDPRWRPMSPGVLLAEATALKACEEGIERYEFMGNEEPRHGTFAHRAHEFETLVYVPLNRQGLRLLGKMVWERSRLKASASPV
jgi:CelD/BcsL family acetyltransferase involved in cellulose biosynthesis